MKANDLSHAFAARTEQRMPQKVTDENRCIPIVDSQPDETVGWVDQGPFEVILVVSKARTPLAI